MREKLIYVAGVLLVVVAGGAVLLLSAKKSAAVTREAEERQKGVAAGPFVRTARVEVTPAVRHVSIPAEVRAWQSAALYAKVSGYVNSITVDKGDVVRKGQVLAVIESPEVDQAVVAAEADLEVRHNDLARAEALSKTGYVSQSQVEQARGAFRVAQSTLERARASRGYEKLVAPFDGVVTARYVDNGALLPAATGSTSGATPLVEVGQLDRLRVYLRLGQEDASLVRVGDSVQLALPGGELDAKVTRLSRALDSKTRTMIAEVDLFPAPAGLVPGAFVTATLALQGRPLPLVPSEALLIQQGHPAVAVLDEKRVHLVRVQTGNDDGRNVEIRDGLKGGETVALDLGVDAVEGQAVQPITQQQQQAR